MSGSRSATGLFIVFLLMTLPVGQVPAAPIATAPVQETGNSAPLAVNSAPGQPVLVSPANDGTGIPTSPTLTVNVIDPDNDPLTVKFYGRPKNAPVGPNFTLAVIPDTQGYTLLYPQIFSAQTQWIVDNRIAFNIPFVTHLGDSVSSGDTESGADAEWINAKNAMYLLETGGVNIPYGVAVGNHDQEIGSDPNSSTNHYNYWFGVDHFAGRPYYGSHYGTNNDTHYELFSASGMNFVIIHIETSDAVPETAVLDWADQVLKDHPNRRGIVVFHSLFDEVYITRFSTSGQAVYNALKDNPNLFLMLGGHVPAESRRTDTYNNVKVYSLLSDYQDLTNGGDGWMRLMEFQPANNLIQVRTFSPTRNNGAGQYETDSNSQFTLAYTMSHDYSLIGSVNVASGADASISWDGLSGSTQYEWYAVVSDGTTSTTGAAWNFTTWVANPTISGNAGVDGAILSYDDGGLKTVTADASGNYSFQVSSNWSGTVTPSKAGYTFSPANTVYSNLTSNQPDQNYAAMPIVYNLSGNTGLGNVLLSYADGVPRTIMADVNGDYSFTVSYSWSGAVTPSRMGYTFTPAEKIYTALLADQANQDYTAVPITYTISGNTGVGGTTLSYADGDPKTAIADDSGNYSFSVSYNWSGTVTPSKLGYTFTPTEKVYTDVLADQANQDYTANAITYTISGSTGVGQTILSYTDGMPKTAVADDNGNYSFTVFYDWSGTVTPLKASNIFTPASRDYAHVLAHQSGQDYTAVAGYNILGNSGVGGATLSFTDGSPRMVTADSDGNYLLTVSGNWSGTVMPSKAGYIFTPAEKAYIDVLADQENQDYSAAAITYTISGNTGISNAVLSYTDGVPKTATADASGNYSFMVSYNWSGTVTPFRVGYIFVPANKIYTGVLADQANQNYTAVPITYAISGNAGVGGAALSYTDGSPKTAVSDGSGNYSFAVSYNWSGVVIPSKGDYAFVPSSITYANVLADQPNQNYLASPVAYIVNFASTGAYDGWMLESSETSNKGGTINAAGKIFPLGSAVADRQYKAILSFDTSAIPDNAVITSAVLKIRQSGKPIGTNPFTVLGNLLVDIRNGTFGKPVLEVTDFQAPASVKKAGIFGKIPSSGWYSVTLYASGNASINKTGLTQFRLYFARDDNNDAVADYMKFVSGNNATGKPGLSITYIVP